MSATVLQRANGYWYVHDASVSHTDLGPFQTKAAAEHYRDTGVDQEGLEDHSSALETYGRS
jgi:hypothetical protein